MTTEAEQRAAVVAEALSWIGTPYRHMGRRKGAGADCAMLPALVYEAAGMIGPVKIDRYPPDWHLHRSAERYLTVVESYATPTSTLLPGDFVLWRVGRAFAHGAIVIAPGWPHIVHADTSAGMVVRAIGDGGRMGGRARRDFTLWPPIAEAA